MPRYKKNIVKKIRPNVELTLKDSQASMHSHDPCQEIDKIVNQQMSEVKIAKEEDKLNLLSAWVSSRTLNSTTLQCSASTIDDASHMTASPLLALEKPAPSTEKAELEIGTINLRLHVPGLFDVLIPVPAPKSGNKTKYLNEIFQQFENKYWCKLKERPQTYKCLICGVRFQKLHSIQTHVAKHMGFTIAHCTKCARHFYSISTAENHLKNCAN